MTQFREKFEAATAFAPAVPLTFDVDHAGLLARFVRQTAARIFPKEMARWKLILAKKTDFDGAKEGSCVARSMLSLEGMGRLDRSKCCRVSSDRSVVLHCGQFEGGCCTEAKTG